MAQRYSIAKGLTRPSSPSWSAIPNKIQLALICSIRIVDFFQQASLQAYMFYQLASFSPDAPESEISFQAGVLQGVFTSAQVFTSPIWGRVADSPAYGRKGVILISLVGQCISCIGLAFSQSFRTAVVWRCLGGAVNATVGGARTALSECTERKYHSRTFLLLPLAWNVANIFGPIVGGLLSDPVKYHPDLFGPNSVFGGSQGVNWLKMYPFAMANLFSAFLLFVDAILIFLFLRETLSPIQNSRDQGLEVAEMLRRLAHKSTFRSNYHLVDQSESSQTFELMQHDDDPEDVLKDTHVGIPPPSSREDRPAAISVRQSNSTRRPMILNIFLVLSTVALLDFQLGAFTSLWSIFLSTSPRSPSDPEPQLPFRFTGGIGFSPSTIGLAMSILGVVGIFCQLALYPRINARFGLLKSTTFSLIFFPLAYVITPYLSLLAPYSDSSSIFVFLWVGIIAIALLVISARTFAVPGSVLLVNNSAPNPQILGTIHGLGAATSSAFRTMGPIVAARWYQVGLEKGRIGEAWWLLAICAVFGCVPIWWVREWV